MPSVPITQTGTIAPQTSPLQPILDGGDAKFTQQQMARLDSGVRDTQIMTPQTATVAPKTLRDGMVRFARSPWRPVSGQTQDAWVYWDGLNQVWKYLDTPDDDSLLATLASPTFTGTPAGPTAAPGTNTTQLATTAFVAAAVNHDVGRNVAQNGEFLIHQRGLGTFANGMTADRWWLTVITDSASTSVISLADADRTAIGDEAALFALQTVVVPAGSGSNQTGAEHRLESTQRYGGKSLTISFWAKSASGTPKIGVGAFQNFGTGGSPSATVNVTATPVTISTTWTRYSVTLAMPTTIGKTIGTTVGTDYTSIKLWYSSGSTNNTIAGGIGAQTNTFIIWAFQVEVGTTATPLEKKNYGQHWLDCQRFYRVYQTVHYVNSMGTGQQHVYSEQIMPPMRITPSVTLLANGNINTSGFSLTPFANYVQVFFTCTSAGDIEVASSYALVADL